MAFCCPGVTRDRATWNRPNYQRPVFDVRRDVAFNASVGRYVSKSERVQLAGYSAEDAAPAYVAPPVPPVVRGIGRPVDRALRHAQAMAAILRAPVLDLPQVANLPPRETKCKPERSEAEKVDAAVWRGALEIARLKLRQKRGALERPYLSAGKGF